jgi:hypothetical protein
MTHPPPITFSVSGMYDDDAVRSPDYSTWPWRLDPTKSPQANFVHKHAYFGRISEVDKDGAPILIWRLAGCDFAGIERENVLDILTDGFLAHFEDALQFGYIHHDIC